MLGILLQLQLHGTVFDNKYFQSMIGIPWRNVQVNGNTTNLFEGVNANLISLNPSIMLNTDMSLGFPVATAETFGTRGVGYLNQTCGPKSVNGSYGCTAGSGSTGLGKNTTRPYTFTLVQQYAKNNQLFLDNFAASFVKLTTVGYGIAPASAGKLGLLTSINLTECAHIPTNAPTNVPTSPTSVPLTTKPSSTPTLTPSIVPSISPSKFPSLLPSVYPSNNPSSAPVKSVKPSIIPTSKPTVIPVVAPTKIPTIQPSFKPTYVPSVKPSLKPTSTAKPNKNPSVAPV